MKLRVKFEDGHFIPLEKVEGIEEGAEFEVELENISHITDSSQIDKMLDRTAGIWADIEGIEEYLIEARQKWEAEWQKKLNSL